MTTSSSRFARLLMFSSLLLPSAAQCGWKDTLLGIISTKKKKEKKQAARVKSCSNCPSTPAPHQPAAPKQAAPSHPDYTLSQEQAHSYISNLIASLDLALRPHVKDSRLQTIKNLLLQTINQPHVCVNTSTGTRYKKDLIDQYVNSVLIQYIAQRSYECALKHTRDEQIALAIADSAFNNVIAIIQKKGVLDAEDLAQFLGKPLSKAIKECVKELKKQQQAQSRPNAPRPSQQQHTKPAHTYPSDECCVCMEGFDAVRQVFLSPCGHDMCAGCACEWFFGDNPNSSCPKCRTNVNITDLARTIQSC